MKIIFQFNYIKAVEAITWLANQEPGLSVFYFSKMLFYAEKFHLQKYARPIIGDKYAPLDHGPVPSIVYDMFKGHWDIDPEIIDSLNQAVEIAQNKYRNTKPLREPNLDMLSGTDIECLQEAFDLCYELDFTELKNLSHTEKAWIKAFQDGDAFLDYELMIDNDVENRDSLIRQIKETAPYIAL